MDLYDHRMENCWEVVRCIGTCIYGTFSCHCREKIQWNLTLCSHLVVSCLGDQHYIIKPKPTQMYYQYSAVSGYKFTNCASAFAADVSLFIWWIFAKHTNAWCMIYRQDSRYHHDCYKCAFSTCWHDMCTILARCVLETWYTTYHDWPTEELEASRVLLKVWRVFYQPESNVPCQNLSIVSTWCMLAWFSYRSSLHLRNQTWQGGMSIMHHFPINGVCMKLAPQKVLTC